MTQQNVSAAPIRELPSSNWEHYQLYVDVREAIGSLPIYFRTETHINVISGSPILFEPFVESAKFAADYRNYHWSHVRQTKSDKGIVRPEGIGPYPSKSDQILDRPYSDGGGNFGRLARTGMMDSYKQKLEDVHLCGIKTTYWRQFLKAFQESTTDAEAHAALERLRQRIQLAYDIPSLRAQSALAILAELERLLDLTE